jgi:hypothetical protein
MINKLTIVIHLAEKLIELSTGEGSGQMKDNVPSSPFEDHGNVQGPEDDSSEGFVRGHSWMYA